MSRVLKVLSVNNIILVLFIVVCVIYLLNKLMVEKQLPTMTEVTISGLVYVINQLLKSNKVLKKDVVTLYKELESHKNYTDLIVENTELTFNQKIDRIKEIIFNDKKKYLRYLSDLKKKKERFESEFQRRNEKAYAHLVKLESRIEQNQKSIKDLQVWKKNLNQTSTT